MENKIKQKIQETQKQIRRETACYNRMVIPTDKAKKRHELDKLEERYKTLLEVYRLFQEE